MEEAQKKDAEHQSGGTEKGGEHDDKDNTSEKPLDNGVDDDDNDALYDDPEGFVDNISDEGNEETPLK